MRLKMKDPKHESDKIIDIGEKMLDFSNQRKKRTQKMNRKQMFQGLPIALAQLKPINTSENLLNEIRQMIYSLYKAKKVTNKGIKQ